MRKKAFSRAILFLVIAAAMTGMFLAAKNAKAKESKQFDSEAAVQGYIAADKLDDVILKSSTSTITITYKPNGGSGLDVKTQVTKGQKFTVKGAVFSRSGYTLAGWAITSSAPNPSFELNKYGASFSSNMNLYAVWYANVSYNANGGKQAPSMQKKIKGTNLTLSTGTPYREGYTFGGWKGSDGVTYSKGAIYKKDVPLTLTAIWNPITYKITYNANGGTGAPDSHTKNYASTVTLSTKKPSRTGYNFVYWKDSSGNTYAPGAKYSGNANLSLTAMWEKQTFKIVFDSNGGSGGPGTLTKVYGETLTIPNTIPTKSGCDFVGWGISSTTSSVAYKAGAAFTNNESKTLYAIWTPKKYTVLFKANGGSGGPDTQVKTHGINLTISSLVPQRTGFDFLGWSTDPNASVSTYTAGSIYANNSSITLYAIWKKQVFYITCNPNGGTGGPGTLTKVYGETLTIPNTIPTKSGYNFLGWGISPTTSEVAYKVGAAFTNNESKTLYAIWTPKKYTVLFKANGGSGGPDTQVKTHGINLTISSLVPQRTGYDFLGWANNQNATTATYTPGSIYGNNSSITLYAVWKKKTYTITFNPNGGNGGPGTLTKVYGETLKIPNTIPTKNGCDFVGWGISSTTSEVAYKAEATYSNNESKTLYAIWTPKKYTVLFKANGGSGGPDMQTKIHGENMIISVQEPQRTGYEFKGWATDSNATVAQYTPECTYTNNSSITLYAVWIPKTYRITYTVYNGTGAPDEQTKTHAIPIMLSTSIPERAGYIFDVWKDKEGNSYKAGEIYSGNSNLDLIAVFKTIELSVKYDGNGGTLIEGMDSSDLSETFMFGNTVTIKDNCFSRSGYLFLGWSENSSAIEPDYSPGDSDVEFTNHTVLYAVWKYIGYRLVLNGNGGEQFDGRSYVAIDLFMDQPIDISQYVFYREDYMLIGWDNQRDAKTARYGIKETIDGFNMDTELYAIWKPINYSVVFNVDYFTQNNDNKENLQFSYPVPIIEWIKGGDFTDADTEGCPTFPDICLVMGDKESSYEENIGGAYPQFLWVPLYEDVYSVSTVWIKGPEFTTNKIMEKNNKRGLKGAQFVGWVKKLDYETHKIVYEDIYKPGDLIDFTEEIEGLDARIEFLALWAPKEMSEEEIKNSFYHYIDNFEVTNHLRDDGFITVDARGYGANQHSSFYSSKEMIEKIVEDLKSSECLVDYEEKLSHDPLFILAFAKTSYDTSSDTLGELILDAEGDAKAFLMAAVRVADSIPAKDCAQFANENREEVVESYLKYGSCGVFAMLNTFYYLSGKKNVSSTEVGEDIIDFLKKQNSFLDWKFRVMANGDLPYNNLTDYLNERLGEYTYEWKNAENSVLGMDYHLLLNDARRMLDEDIPVIAAYVGPLIHPYIIENGRFIRDENVRDYGNHYFVITGILEDSCGENIYLQVSSGGRKEYLLYEEYMANASFNAINLNIDGIKDENSIKNALSSLLRGYETSYMCIRRY